MGAGTAPPQFYTQIGRICTPGCSLAQIANGSVASGQMLSLTRPNGLRSFWLKGRGEQSVALDRAGIMVFRATMFLAAGPASERSRSAARELRWFYTNSP